MVPLNIWNGRIFVFFVIVDAVAHAQTHNAYNFCYKVETCFFLMGYYMASLKFKSSDLTHSQTFNAYYFSFVGVKSRQFL